MSAETGNRWNADRVMMIASQSFAAARATNARRFSPARSSAGGGEHPRLRVELKELAGELLEHVVRDDHGGLLDHRQAAKLARADHHLGGLARTNLVKQPDGGL